MIRNSLPPSRDLPPGRLAVRREHLLAETTVIGRAPTAASAFRGGRRRLLVATVVALVAIGGPALALSATLRQLVGLSFPHPILRDARLQVTAPAPHGQVLRLYTAPTREGGECWFVSVADARSRPSPNLRGSASCTVTKGAKLHSSKLPLEASWSMARRGDGQGARTWIAASVDGWVSPVLHATRVQLEWAHGRQRLRLENNYFLGAAPVLYSPSFADLPFYLVAYDANGVEVARQKLGNAGLYLDWKHDRIQSKLRAYRLLHPNPAQAATQTPTWLATRVRAILRAEFPRARLAALDYIDYPRKTAVILEFDRPVNPSGPSTVVRLSYDRRTHEPAATIRYCPSRPACLHR
jgi:hypothetical protein